MKKKSQIIWLTSIFILLGGYVLIFENPLKESKEQKAEFNRPFYSFDSNEIKAISIKPNQGQAINLQKIDEKWMLINEDYPANQESIEQLINLVKDAKVQQVVSNKPENWAKFEVSDKEGIEVMMQGKNSKEVANFRIGKTGESYQSQFVRKNKGNEVLLVNQMLGIYFSRPIDAWKDQTILSLDQTAIQGITIIAKDKSERVLARAGSGWILNGEHLADEKANTLLTKISDLKTDSFPKENALFDVSDADFIFMVQLENQTVELSLKVDESGDNYYTQIKGNSILFKISRTKAEDLTLFDKEPTAA